MWLENTVNPWRNTATSLLQVLFSSAALCLKEKVTLYGCFAFLYVSGGLKKILDPYELELQTVVSCHVSVGN